MKEFAIKHETAGLINGSVGKDEHQAWVRAWECNSYLMQIRLRYKNSFDNYVANAISDGFRCAKITCTEAIE